MAGNDGIKNIFGKIGLKRFIGFDGWFGWREKAISGNSLEKDKKNN